MTDHAGPNPPSDTRRVALCEDDDEMAAEIRRLLDEAGFAVRRFATGEALLGAARSGFADVLVLDRRLPDWEGLEVLAELKRRGVSLPTLILSALSDLNERVRGLRAGGDDYLCKPFEPIELVARLEALLRRPSGSGETQLRQGSLVLDLVAKKAWRGERELELLSREFEVLAYLLRSEGSVVTRAMLLRDVWHYNFEPKSNVVDVHMGRLRRKLDTETDMPMISSVRGRGYRLSVR
ncbi:DNA-binding response regulator [Fulvimarina endophytica]|uniref:DNA-binding response regulator n=1 Tax=Fulvimarina endophytica TaxID=2293836 RepID=A0A371WYF3_9HYPH|nr:response regulator transcription factor [Fulvimarina endophytica]RFC62013.1 DNA-binding response regulator [Fulvimarina endophytica]